MRTDFFYPSCGVGQIHGCRWTPDTEVTGVVQIVHGIAEHVERYDEFAEFLNSRGFLVVAEDHMGHGQSIGDQGKQGYFEGGWFAAVQDTETLLENTGKEYPGLPYVLFGHSMGSFMVRTILAKYPDNGISAAIVCGTGWQNRAMLPAAIQLCKLLSRNGMETKPNYKLNSLIFGGYNNKIEHRRTDFDWLTREDDIVDAYIADPLCGFVATTGLFRELLVGMRWVEDPKNLKKMKKDLPVYFISGEADPVGSYGKGVEKAADAFCQAGMKRVSRKLWPLCRHEILNEWNRQEIYGDVAEWVEKNTK